MDDSARPLSLNQRVANGIRAELARTGMSRETLARHLGISVAALRRRMDDETSFKVSEVEAACKMFGIEPNELIRSSLALDAVRIVATGDIYIEMGSPAASN